MSGRDARGQAAATHGGFTSSAGTTPDTDQDEFDWRGWVGVRDLPEFRKSSAGPHSEVKQHLRHVLRRWMDPNGDGNPDDGVDGWRLDVAAELPLPFWQEFRGWVHEINPDAYLTGEIWWEDYAAGTMVNAAPWLQGDAFDGVMNYRLGDAIYRFINQQGSANEFGQQITTLIEQYGLRQVLAVQSLPGQSRHRSARLHGSQPAMHD